MLSRSGSKTRVLASACLPPAIGAVLALSAVGRATAPIAPEARAGEPHSLPPGTHLELVGQVGATVGAVAWSGDLAIAGLGQRLVALSLENASAPVPVGETAPLGDEITDIEVVSRTAYVAAGGTGLHVIDLTDPRRPAIVHSIDTPGRALAVSVGEGLAAVADGEAGLQLVELPAAGAPRLVGEATTSRTSRDVELHGGRAYVAERTEWESVVRVVDLSDPSRPVEMAALVLSAPVDALVVHEGWLVLAGRSDSPVVLRIGATGGLEPARGGQPGPIETHRTLQAVGLGPPEDPSRLSAIMAHEGFVFVGSNWRAAGGTAATLRTYHIEPDGRPIGRSSMMLPGNVMGLAASGDRCAVALNEAGLQTLRIPRQMHGSVESIGVFTGLGRVRAVAVLGGAAYVADSLGALVTIDVSRPENPTMAGRLPLPVGAWDIAVSEDRPVSGQDRTPPPVGVSRTLGDSTAPTFRDAQSELDGAWAMLVGERYPTDPDSPYTVPWRAGAWKLGLVEPLVPRVIAVSRLTAYEQTSNLTAKGLALSGNRAFVASPAADFQRTAHLVEIETTEGELEWGDADSLGLADASDVVVAGDHAYVADRVEGIHVVNIGVPGTMRYVGVVASPGQATGLEVSGDRLYAAVGSDGLAVFSLEAVALPRLLGVLDTPGDARRVSGTSHAAVVADGYHGVRLIRTSDPVRPQELARHVPKGYVEDVELVGDLVYVAIREARLQILRIVTPEPTATPTASVAPEPTGRRTVFLPLCRTGHNGFSGDGHPAFRDER